MAVRSSSDPAFYAVEFLVTFRLTTLEEPTMTIAQELEAQILRYYHAEKWRIGTIAAQLGVHRGTVQRVLAQAGLPARAPLQRPSRVDSYLPFIQGTLAQFPTLTASRLYQLVRERGSRPFPPSGCLASTPSEGGSLS